MVDFRKSHCRRISGLLLIVLIWPYLSAGDEVQTVHALREASFHSFGPTGAEALREPASSAERHNCHSCLLSHPFFWSGSPAQRYWHAAHSPGSLTDRPFDLMMPVAALTGPCERSPPSGPFKEVIPPAR